MNLSFRKIAKLTLVLVYLVIIAGAVVRMTGSGMGCPDWPKCFGYYIPPTNAEVLEWRPQREFEKGQVIIVDETLQIAQSNFTALGHYNSANWKPYTKHDYAIFNVWHTWIEYINRLLGALAGLFTLILAVYSIRYWKTDKSVTILSWLTVLGMGFQAWLGATVVYSVLAPVKITVHMVMALLIVAFLLLIIFRVKPNKRSQKTFLPLNYLFVAVLLLTLIQIILGTQVRQFVDEQVKIVGENSKDLWLLEPNLQFYIHRSLSILVLAANVFLWFTIKAKKLYFPKINWVLVLIGLEIITGISMYYIDFPFGSQPAHLVLASLLFGVQFYLILETINVKGSLKTS